LKFISYIKELFNSRSYHKVESNNRYQEVYVFNDGKNDHYINFDEFMPNAYNLYFYHLDYNGERTFYLTKDRGGKEFEIFGNVKNCVHQFIEEHPYILFLGFSSYAYERRDLYFMFLQSIASNKFHYFVKNQDNVEYYFIISEEIPKLLRQTYIDNFIRKDIKNKK